MSLIAREAVTTIAAFLHSGGPPLAADDAAVAIVRALAEDQFVIMSADDWQGAVRARELAQALVDLVDENTNIKAVRAVAAEIVTLLPGPQGSDTE